MNNLIEELRSSPSVPLILHGKMIFPAMSNGLIRVQGPKSFVNTMIVMEPTCVRNHFLIGGTALTLDNDARGYLPAMNILDKQVEIENHQYIGEAYVVKDPRHWSRRNIFRTRIQQAKFRPAVESGTVERR
jgi:hypothetical protein